MMQELGIFQQNFQKELATLIYEAYPRKLWF